MIKKTIAILLLAAFFFPADHSDDFSKGFLSWEIVSGDWKAENGMIKGSSGGGEGLLLLKDKLFANFTLECRIKVENREGSLAFRVKDKDNLYLLVFNPKISDESQGSVLLIRRLNGKETYFAGSEQYVWRNEWVKLKISAVKEKLEVYVNGKMTVSVDDKNLKEGRAGLRVFGDFFNGCDAYFDDFSIKAVK